MPHPYDENSENGSKTPHYAKQKAEFGDIDEIVGRAVQFGTRLGSEVLDSISAALQDSIYGGRTAADPAASATPQALFRHHCRKLDSRLGSGQIGWMTAGILGWSFAACFLIAFIVMLSLALAGPHVPGTLWQYRTLFSALAALFASLTIGFGALGWLGVRRAGAFARLRRYLKCMRGWTATLAQLAWDAVVKPSQARRDLQKAVANGRLGAAYYDAGTDTLYLDESHYRPPQPQADEVTDDAALFDAEGAAFLRYLGGCRGALGADADAELDAMRRTCTAILDFVRAHPEQLPRVRRFREYYLPTTRKLLDTALGLPNADTANAQTIRRDITGILHTLNTAFGTLYDTLLQDVSLDISAEIDTLETMLGQDGLTHDFHSDFGTNG